MWIFGLFLFTTLFSAKESYQTQYDKSCGYNSCPKYDPSNLNVHIVPHTHNDVGWLKTIDQYYYGRSNKIYKAGVQYILDSVVKALLQNPKRRFIYVEMAYFFKWWEEKSDLVREQVKHLINNGQLEIAGGGWSMNDEATTHYQATIDQFTWGFRKLNETFGECARPKVGWQIDPFGHSREMASMLSQFGFDGLFFARIDYRDKLNRLQNKTAEMIWRGSQSLDPSSSEIFTSVLYNHYSAPPGFCFDVMCADPPIVENKESPEYNAEERAKLFLWYVEKQAKYYKTNNIIITMGDDFHYQDAVMYFTNMDRLLKAIEELGTKTKVYYSSPSCYLKAVNEAKAKWPLKTDDFFPYASDPHTYWTGYFTSRPTLKRFERMGNNFLQVCKQLSSLANIPDGSPGLNSLREAMGVLQHHDAIAGTERQHVANDYARILHQAMEDSEVVANEALRKITGLQLDFKSCLLLNISQCEFTENHDDFVVTVYNQLSRPVTHYVRVPVSKEGYQVMDMTGNVLESQYVQIFEMLMNIPGRNSSATHELVFRAESVPALGYKMYNVKYVLGLKNQNIAHNSTNKRIQINLHTSGHLQSITINGRTTSLHQKFLYYIGALGQNSDSKDRSSGAYIFRPRNQVPLAISNNCSVVAHSGPLVTEYHQKCNDWVGQVIRVYAHEDHVEFNWVIGPIPIEDDSGKEIITRFSTNFQNNGVFYTDSNGREMMKRIRGNRSTYNLTKEEPVAQNYYPVTSRIVIQDESTGEEMAVLNDRSQGGSSLHDGEIELMVHRRLLHDDGLGVAEALDEVAYGKGLVATGKLYLRIGEKQNNQGESVSMKEKLLSQHVLSSPWIFFSTNTVKKNDRSKFEFSGLRKRLPSNVQILTLESWGSNTILLRLEHFLEKNEDPKLSAPATVNIGSLFSTFRLLEVKEMALDGNQLLSEVHRLKWQSEEIDNEVNNNEINKNKKGSEDQNEIVMHPMEIKTFIVKIEPMTAL